MEKTARSLEARLADQPELLARIESILDITEGTCGGPDTADDIEERAILELNKLGLEVMAQWGTAKSKREVASHRELHPKAHIHKKKRVGGTPALVESK